MPFTATGQPASASTLGHGRLRGAGAGVRIPAAAPHRVRA